MQGISRAAWLASGRVTGDALAFALFVLVAREFGPEGTGLYAFHFAIATVLYELVSLGIEDYGVREYARRPAEAARALLASLFGAQILLAAAIAGSVLLTGAAVGSIHLPLLACVIVYQFAFALARTLFIPAFVGGAVCLQVFAETAVRAAVLGTALLVVRLAHDAALPFALIGLPIFGVVLLAVALASARRSAGMRRPNFAPSGVRELLVAIWPFATANFVSGLYTRTGLLVLFVLAGTAEAGFLAGAYKFAELGWALLTLIPIAAYPLMTRARHADPAAFRVLSTGLLGVTLLCGGLFAWGTYWLIPPLAQWLLGPEFAATAPLLRMLAMFVALVALTEVLERLLLTADLQMSRMRIVLAQAGIHLGLCLLLVPRLGAAGAALALVAAQLLTAALLLHAARAVIGLREVTRTIAIYAAALAGAALMGGLLAQHSAAPWLPPVLALLTFMVIAHAGGLLRPSCLPGTELLRAAR